MEFTHDQKTTPVPFLDCVMDAGSHQSTVFDNDTRSGARYFLPVLASEISSVYDKLMVDDGYLTFLLGIHGI